MSTRPHRLIYETDGRHPNIYQFEPPLTREQLELVVDEVVGTPVDTIFYYTGDGRTQIYDTRVSEVWGHNVESWRHLVFYRTAKSVRQLIEAGLDPLGVVGDRAHAKGLSFFPSLPVQQPREEGNPNGRCSDFYLNNPQLQIGPGDGIDPQSPRARCLDWAHEVVREERFSIVDELIESYPIDGIQLHMYYIGGHPYFKPQETEANLPLLTTWVKRIRRRLDEVGDRRGQYLELAVEVPGSIAACLKLGIDIETWVRDGLVNLVSPQMLDNNMQQDLNLQPFVDLARGTGCHVIGGLVGSVDSEEHGEGTLAHYRAAATNLWRQGIDGILLPHFWGHWPYHADDYAILRELPHPDVMAWGNKHYFVPTLLPRTRSVDSYLGYQPQLPVAVAPGQAAEARFTVSDDLRLAEAQGRLTEVALHLRLMGTECDDAYEVRLNGQVLPDSQLEKRDFTYYMVTPRYRAGYGYWFDYRLDPTSWPGQGENRVSVELLRRDPELAVLVELSNVELTVQYRPGRNWWRWAVAP